MRVIDTHETFERCVAMISEGSGLERSGGGRRENGKGRRNSASGGRTLDARSNDTDFFSSNIVTL